MAVQLLIDLFFDNPWQFGGFQAGGQKPCIKCSDLLLIKIQESIVLKSFESLVDKHNYGIEICSEKRIVRIVVGRFLFLNR